MLIAGIVPRRRPASHGVSFRRMPEGQGSYCPKRSRRLARGNHSHSERATSKPSLFHTPPASPAHPGLHKCSCFWDVPLLRSMTDRTIEDAATSPAAFPRHRHDGFGNPRTWLITKGGG